MATRYLVKDEHTLGYMYDSHPLLFGILAGNVFKGGHDPLEGWTFIIPGHTKLRPATKADFAAYRVVPPSNWTEQPA